MQKYEMYRSVCGKLHRQDVNLNLTLKNGQVFRIVCESRDRAWAKRH